MAIGSGTYHRAGSVATTPRRAERSSTLGALLRDARERLAQRTGVRVRQTDVAELADITVESIRSTDLVIAITPP
jgi:putative NADH-flavin reductase